ncbi:hypothetical protein X474_06420 [Dethiosulfatarculus sandiegensis]|uniref:Uncharacterized protein n=1 Tax=Dethiosulfatarculus sandiegensis TaxID=1429043 RepID=A0A0D2HWL9_9BACT|nr:hypothetical protein X474_06420 [Dethiosulfatarculus sandiegensis]
MHVRPLVWSAGKQNTGFTLFGLHPAFNRVF